jgi:glutathione synthase/RimK-type ligase-like ATP-grasp enzyme
MIYDHLLHEPFRKRGFQVEEIPWDAPGVDWSHYHSVIIRSPWDYQQKPTAFLQTLQQIHEATRLENTLETVQWNIHKKYLADLEQRGVAIVPTIFLNTTGNASLQTAMNTLGGEAFVIKPAISANADDTFVISTGTGLTAHQKQRLTGRDLLLQPFLPAIQTEGEYSLFFFGDVLSHTILKTPESGDFRVQEEHGGRLSRVENPEPALLEAAWKCWKAIAPVPLYGRVDLVRDKGQFLLMEVELIEPSLYFILDDASPERFADAFVRRLRV